MIYCDNVNCDQPDEALERISDYRVVDGAVLCAGCDEAERDAISRSHDEGRAAYVLGSGPDDNPYRAAMARYHGDALHRVLQDWEYQWDSGYEVAQRESHFNA
jgi:hypothetical protein